MKSVWFKFLCFIFGHRWRVIARSDDEDGDILYWRGPPKGCFSMCVVCTEIQDDLARKQINGLG